MSETLLWLAMWLAPLAIFMLRNTVVYRIRVHFLWDEPDGFYEALPTYDTMLWRHWGKWTNGQWRRYVVTHPSDIARARVRVGEGQS